MKELRTETSRFEMLASIYGKEKYGVAILKGQEIRGCDVVTRIPTVLHCVKGAVNLG